MMSILSSKWIMALAIVLAVLVLLWVIGKKSAKAEIVIHASPEDVWAVLTDTRTVKNWNKVLIPIQGNLHEGNTVKYEFYQEENGKAAVMDAKVKQLTTNSMINQSGGFPGIMTFDHKYIIDPTESATTVKIYEVYRGIMVPFWNPTPVEKSYERLLLQLKNHVENG